jgi:ferredoxin
MNFLVIDPEVCIDCGLCVPECPVQAIVPEDDLPDDWSEYLELNAKYSADWPVIDTQKDSLPTAEENREKTGKLPMLDPTPFSE